MGNQNNNVYTEEDIQKNKIIAAVAYLIFFIPLIAAPDSEFGKFHTNQGLVLFIVGFLGNIVLTLLPIIGWLLAPLFNLGLFILGILGFVNALNGKAVNLPLIGNYQILK